MIEPPDNFEPYLLYFGQKPLLKVSVMSVALLGQNNYP